MPTSASTKKEQLAFLPGPTLFGYEVHNGHGDHGYYHCREALIRDAKTYTSKPNGDKIFFNNGLKISHKSITTKADVERAVHCLDTLLIPVAIYTAPKGISLTKLTFNPGEWDTFEGKFKNDYGLYGGAENPKCMIDYKGIPSELLWCSPVHASLYFGVAKLCLTISKKYPTLLDEILALREKALGVAKSKNKTKAKGILLSIKNIICNKYATANSDLMPMVSPMSFQAIDKLAKGTSIKLGATSTNWKNGDNLFVKAHKKIPFGFGDYEKFSSMFK